MSVIELFLRKAEPCEAERVIDFYYKLIDDLHEINYYINWEKDIYPDKDYLRNAVIAGDMYLAETGGETVGAMVLNHTVNEGYDDAEWGINAAPSEVTVVHALGTKLDKTRCGVGSFMVKESLRIARENGQKTVRLDALKGNTPANNLYRKCGFKYISTVDVYYDYTGDCQFDLYEYVLVR